MTDSIGDSPQKKDNFASDSKQTKKEDPTKYDRSKCSSETTNKLLRSRRSIENICEHSKQTKRRPDQVWQKQVQ
jgi:hypothetical protein